MENPQLIPYSMVKTGSLPVKSGVRLGCPLSLFLVNIVLKVLDRAVKQEGEIKVIQIVKENTRLLLFANDMIFYIHKQRNSPK